MSVNRRERVRAALNHQEADRIPLDLGSTRNTGILVEPYQRLVHHLGLGEEELARDDFGVSKIVGLAKPSEEVLQKLDIDFRGVYLRKADFSMEKEFVDGSHQDELGVIRRKPAGSPYYDLVRAPFGCEISISDVINWQWPDPHDPGYTRGLRKEAEFIRRTVDCGLVLHLQDVIVHSSQFMRGFERWYMDFVLNPNLICALMDALLEVRMVVTKEALEQVGDLVDVVSCSDDVADQRGPQISPQMFRKYIKPRLMRYFDVVRSGTQAKLLFHSCGSVTKLLPDFIDLGIDFLNPIQVSADGMDTAWLKDEYGDQIGFWGAIDTTRVLPFGGVDHVRREVRKRIGDLAPGGGYILSAVHNIQPDVPPENVVAMFEEARCAGIYPIYDEDAAGAIKEKFG